MAEANNENKGVSQNANRMPLHNIIFQIANNCHILLTFRHYTDAGNRREKSKFIMLVANASMCFLLLSNPCILEE